MKRKSQITLFILFGILLLIGLVFASQIKNRAVTQNAGQIDISPIELYVKNCLESTGKKALISVGKHSGYYQLKSPYLKDKNFNLSYYFFDGISFQQRCIGCLLMT